MKKLVVILSLFVSTVQAQYVVHDQLSIGTVNQIDSKILKERRTVWVGLPTSYYEHQFAKARYPVIYVLDGDANFAMVSAMAKQLSIRNGNTELPEAIVVGILNTDRERDFTPTHSYFSTQGILPPTVKTGGGEDFTAFIESELMPYIDARYPTAPYKILIGHSLGGLATANVLINHTRLFNGYIMIDPSMWWDNRKFLEHAKHTLEQQSFQAVSVYLGIANNLKSDIDTTALRTDTSMSTFHTRSIFLFKDALQKNKRNGLHFKYEFYPREPHMSAPLITVYDGLHFLFDFYTMPSGWIADFFNPDNHTDLAQLFTNHYQQVSRHMGYQVLPSESLVNNYANTALESCMPDKALALYELNITNYPVSFGAYVKLGDYYSNRHETKEAIANYKMALKLKKDKNTQRKVAALLKK